MMYKHRIIAQTCGVCVLILGGLNSVWALDQSIFGTIQPIQYYNPDTDETRPYYPIGWYRFGTVNSFSEMQEIAATGANTVLLTDIWDQDNWHYPNTQYDLDWAQQLGMKVVIAFHRSMLMNVKYNDPSTYAHLDRWINVYKNHPALLGWQLGDEEAYGGTPVQAIKDSARIIRQWDPNHPIWQVGADVSDSQIIAYMDGTDVYGIDFYQYFDALYPTGQFVRCSNLLAFYTHHAVLAANNGWTGNVNVTQAVGPDSGNLYYYRFPTAGEYRWSIFSNMASAGARGTFNWVYYTGTNWYSNPTTFHNFCTQIVTPVFGELRKLTHALETGWNVGSVSLPTGWAGTYKQMSNLLLYDDYQRKYFLIVTNNTSSTRSFSATMSDLPTYLRNVSVTAFTGGTPAVENLVSSGNNEYRLDSQLSNWGVGVYEFADYNKETIYNGNINTTNGWTSVGSTVYYDSAITHTADSSGSLKVWASSEGAGSGKWTQWVGVTPNMSYTLRWYARAGGNSRYFKYSITNKAGAVLQAGGPTRADEGWMEYSVIFNSGNSDIVYINFISYTVDWVVFDDILLEPHAVTNENINTTSGWISVGSTVYYDYANTCTADGSGSLKVWASSPGAASGQWTQTIGVEPNKPYTLRWYARAGGNGRSFKYSILNKSGGTIVSGGPITANGSWIEYTATFNSGSSDSIKICFISHSVDWVLFDDILLLPNTVINETICTSYRWSSTGTTTAYLDDLSKDVDGSGCLKVWDSGGGVGSGKWTQAIGTVPYTSYNLRWFASAGGNGRYFKYSITNKAGTVIQSGGPIVANADWAECSVTFNCGNTDIIYITFISYSVDWVLFDNISLTALELMIPGDANSDGKVDVGDLGILAANYGKSFMGWAQGDFNGDRKVDIADLGILASYYSYKSSDNFNPEEFERTIFAAESLQKFDDEESDDLAAGMPCLSGGLALIGMGLLFSIITVKLD